MNANKVLTTALLTEKANLLSATYGQYAFEVAPTATKFAIRQAVEQTFKVTVTRVNVMNVRGKNKKSRQGRPSQTSDFKKAIVTLKSGDKIELV
ncbi:MAG TPA: 50S ribosomal protein L23 [Opitutaceae bacterium]|nr:50S ribosomal protein L23 [Opitutaceae bacterium]